MAIAAVAMRMDGPVLLVMSSDIHDLDVSDRGGTSHRCALVTTRVAGNEHHGWIRLPAPAAGEE